MPRKTLRERLRRPLLILFPILLAAVGAAYYLAEEPYVSTDDAFVRAAKESVNARVAGQVVEIAVIDNQRVQRGQLLFQIDPEPYQIAVDQAEARLGSARLQIDELKATFRQQLAELQSASASADFDQREYARRKALVTDGWTPREVFDRADMDSQGRPSAHRRRSNNRSPTPWPRWTAIRISTSIAIRRSAQPRPSSTGPGSISPTRRWWRPTTAS